MRQRRGGVLLREWLKEDRRSQEWLASQIGTRQTSVSAWIHGRSIPVGMAIKIRTITGIPLEEWAVDAEESGAVLPAEHKKATG